MGVASSKLKEVEVEVALPLSSSGGAIYYCFVKVYGATRWVLHPTTGGEWAQQAQA